MLDTSCRRFETTGVSTVFPFSQQIKHKDRCVCYPPQPYPLSDASPACSANKVRPLHDKVQSRIIKLEKDRETERNWHRHQTERKDLVRGRTQRSGSGANFWIGALKKTVPTSLPTHPPPPPTPLLWCICHNEERKKGDTKMLFNHPWLLASYESVSLQPPRGLALTGLVWNTPVFVSEGKSDSKRPRQPEGKK